MISLVALLIEGCQEIGPTIKWNCPGMTELVDTAFFQPDSTPAAQARKVLIEEFTGVQCNNCPPGHTLIRQLINDHPDSIIAVAIHNANFLADPYPDGEDFRLNPEGFDISDALGGTGAIPGAAFDRYDFNPNDGRIAEWGTSTWAARTGERLGLPTKLNVDLSSTYDAGTRELVARIEIRYTSDVTETHSVTMMVTESGIINPQLLPDLSRDDVYEHNHILRAVLSASAGDLIAPPKVTGWVVIKEYAITIPAEWDESNCHIVGFVHQTGASKEVFQAGKANIN